MTAAELIRSKRREHRFTQIELAAALNIKQPLISRWEQGVLTPSMHRCAQLESLLQIDVGLLLILVGYDCDTDSIPRRLVGE